MTPTDRLRQAGLRVTRPRLAVLDVLAERSHVSAEEVLTAVRTRQDVSVQAVYDVLHTLTDHGLVRRIQPARSVARFELHSGDNHHHLVCRSCGDVVDVPCAVGQAPCLTPGAPSGHPSDYAVDEAEVIWWGTCPTCTRSTPATSTPQEKA